MCSHLFGSAVLGLGLLLSATSAFGAKNFVDRDATQPPYTSFVNLFIGTSSGANGGSGGNGFPGAAIPHAMVKVTSEHRPTIPGAILYI